MGQLTSIMKTRSPIILNFLSVQHDFHSDAQQNQLLLPEVDLQILSEQLEQLMKRLLSHFISDDGKFVDYEGMRASKTFAEYLEFAAQLLDIDLEILLSGKNVSFRKAFFINLYNAMTMHAIVVSMTGEKHHGMNRSVLKQENFWQRYAYRIGNMVFSLDDIEHGILRGNKAHPLRAKLFQ